jgi:hypothetical protein
MVSYEISFLCGALSLFVGAASTITIELVHPGCIQRQREPCVNVLGCFMKNLRWPLARIMHILSWLCVCISVALVSGWCIVCLPAALCLLWFVTSILSLIEVWLTKCLVLGSAKEPNKWSPATPRAIKRKAHVRERRLNKQATRLLARCLRQTHRSHGPFVAWLFKPDVYPRVCKALVVLRFLSWCCHLVFAFTTTRLLFGHFRILAILFYACCVFGSPLLPSASDIFLASLALVAARRHTERVDAHGDAACVRDANEQCSKWFIT